VADLGAGKGYFTFRPARAVGASGRVHAVEVGERRLRTLSRLAERGGFSQVELVRGDLDAPHLPDRSIDRVLLSSVYHHLDGGGR
jgi:ubiquinone/menaquinone biosynthesis C-methylase UbiE